MEENETELLQQARQEHKMNTETEDHNIELTHGRETESISNGTEKSKCRVCCQNCYKSYCRMIAPCLADGHKPDTRASGCEKCKYAMLCPPHGPVGRRLTVILLAAVAFTSAWCILGETVLPGGNIFGLLVLFVLCNLAGILVSLIKLPPLLGMILMGGLLRNIPGINVAKDIDSAWLTCIRSAALVVILLRAGLGLDPASLKKLSFVVLRLAFTPCLVEGAVVAVASHLILGFPWAWGALLGLVLGAVTPAVIVPCMLSLAEQGLGVGKGIPTLVIAASSIDDVIAITGFSLTLGFVFGSGHLADTLTRGPREVLLGLVLGIIYGLFLWYLPISKSVEKRWWRLGLLLGGGCMFMFGSEKGDFPSAGPIGCLALAFVAAHGWRTDTQPGCEEVDMLMERVWSVAEPFMFGLIGAEIDVAMLDATTAGLGAAALMIGLTFRTLASFLVVFGTDLTVKEKLFVSLAWLPKATVQAAIGPVAFDTAVKSNGTDNERQMGLQILTIAVMSIILTAPLGGALILLTGPKLLSKHPVTTCEDGIAEEDGLNQPLRGLGLTEDKE